MKSVIGRRCFNSNKKYSEARKIITFKIKQLKLLTIIRNIKILQAGSLGFPGGASDKNPPANAVDLEDMGSNPGLGRFPGGGHGNPSSILAWRIPWTEEPGRLQPLGLQRVRHDYSDLVHTKADTKSGRFSYISCLLSYKK